MPFGVRGGLVGFPVCSEWAWLGWREIVGSLVSKTVTGLDPSIVDHPNLNS